MKNKNPANRQEKNIRNREKGGESHEFWWRCGRPGRAILSGRGLITACAYPARLQKILLYFLPAVLKDQKKTYGKTRMVRMLKENRPLKFFTVPSDRLKEFAREGKKRGLLYVVIRDRKNPSQCEIMVFADDAAKVNRVMDKMNLDFLKSESGEAVQEVAMEADRNQEMPEAPTETVEMPEGEIQFELGDMEQDLGLMNQRRIWKILAGAGRKESVQDLPRAAKIFLPGRKSLNRIY